MMEDPEFAGRFAREIRSLVKLVHPHIVKVMDVGEQDGLPFAVMQYLPGGSLRPGGVADIVAFDPLALWTVDPTRIRSRSRNTPWAGETLPGVVKLTVVGGRVVFPA